MAVWTISAHSRGGRRSGPVKSYQQNRKTGKVRSRGGSGYTECQTAIAEWIGLGHDELRHNSQYRCYVCSGESSTWYEQVKALGFGATLEQPGNSMASFTFSAPNKWKTAWHEITVPAKEYVKDVQSSSCGMVFRVHVQQSGRSRVAGSIG